MRIAGPRPAARRRRGTAAAVLGVLVAAGAVGRTTDATFTASTSTSASMAAGSVTLADDDNGQALLQAAGMVPGTSVTNCVTVTYSGSLAAITRLYADSLTGSLAPYLNVVIESGSGGGYGSCGGFSPATTVYAGTLQTLVTTHGSFRDGLVGFDPSGPSSRVYRVTYTLDAAAPDAAQGATATAALRWQARDGIGYDGQVLADGPVSFWRLDDAAAATSAAARVGGVTGAFSGTVQLGVAGPTGDGHTAVAFDGSGGTISFGDVDDLRGDAPFSIELWARPVPGNVTSFRRILTKSDQNTGWNVLYSNSDNAAGGYPDTFYYDRYDDIGGYAYNHPGNGVLAQGQWHHLLITDDGTTINGYVDGVLARTRTYTLVVPDTTIPLVVGSAASATSFIGSVADIAVYPYAMTAAQASAHYAAR